MAATPWNNLKILRVAGLATWALVGVPLLIRSLGHTSPERLLAGPTILKLWLAYLAFGYAYWFIASERIKSDFARIVALLVMTVTPVLINYFTSSGIGVLLLIVAAGILPWFRDSPMAMYWVVVQSFLNLPVFLALGRYSLAESVLQCGLFLGCSGFIFMVSWIARQQSEARERMRQVNAELRVAQSLLVESERGAERLRISRELHDLVGHHLTALSLNLEVASHLTEGKAREHVLQAQQLSRLLLADVREVVSTLRRDEGVDLAGAIRELTSDVPGLAIHLDLPDNFSVPDTARAQVVLRLVQEVLTNTIRHARARNLWLTFTTEAGEVRFVARDDGCGAPQLKPGNGLEGMRERLAQVGGRLRIETGEGRGFALLAGMPMEAHG